MFLSGGENVQKTKEDAKFVELPDTAGRSASS